MPSFKWRSDNVVEVNNLLDEINNTVITNARVTVHIRDKKGQLVPTSEYPIQLTHVGSGNYRAVISKSIEFHRNATYYATFIADAGLNLYREWEVEYTIDTGEDV